MRNFRSIGTGLRIYRQTDITKSIQLVTPNQRMLMNREGANVSCAKMLITMREHRKRASSKIKFHHPIRRRNELHLYKQNIYKNRLCVASLFYFLWEIKDSFVFYKSWFIKELQGKNKFYKVAKDTYWIGKVGGGSSFLALNAGIVVLCPGHAWVNCDRHLTRHFEY